MSNDERLTGMTESEYITHESESSPSGTVTSWEAQAVDEIIEQEKDEIYHEKIALSRGVCPVCYTELSEESDFIDENLREAIYYCPRCGYESDPHHD